MALLNLQQLCFRDIFKSIQIFRSFAQRERETLFPYIFQPKTLLFPFIALLNQGEPHSILPWQRWEETFQPCSYLAVEILSSLPLKRKKKKDKLEDIAKQLCGIILRQFRAAIPSVKPRLNLVVVLDGSVYIHYYPTKSAFTSIVLLFVFYVFLDNFK